MHPGHNGLVMLPWNLLILCHQNLETYGADGLSAFRGRLVELSDQEEDRVASSLQLRRPVTNFCPPAGGVSAEAAGCELPDSFWLTTWWWTRATRTKISATIKSSSAMLTELACSQLSSMLSSKGKINISYYFCLFVIMHRTKEGETCFINSHIPFEFSCRNDGENWELR